VLIMFLCYFQPAYYLALCFIWLNLHFVGEKKSLTELYAHSPCNYITVCHFPFDCCVTLAYKFSAQLHFLANWLKGTNCEILLCCNDIVKVTANDYWFSAVTVELTYTQVDSVMTSAFNLYMYICKKYDCMYKWPYI